MGKISNYLENALLDHVLGGSTYTQPATIYVALYLDDPAVGAEVSGGGYSRKAVTFDAASSRAKLSNNTITFTADGADWGTVTHVALKDASTGGNLLWYRSLQNSGGGVESFAVDDGLSIEFAAGNIKVRFSSGNISDFLANSLLDHVFGGPTYPQPATIYTALFVSATTDAGGGTEVSGNGYSRQVSTFSAASGGSASTSADLEFVADGGSFGDVSHIAEFDASTAGNMLFHGAATTTQTVADGKAYKVAAGDLTCSLD